MDTIHLLHALFHSVAGIDYPRHHWWFELGAALMLVVAPVWGIWIAVRSTARRVRAWRAAAARRVLGASVREGAWAADRWGLETFVLRASLRHQIRVAVLCVLTLPSAWLLLEIPKRIVNQALADVSKAVDHDVSFLGIPLDRKELLFVLCASYLAALSLNGAIKYATHYLRGVINERLVRRLRLAVLRQAPHARSDERRATLAAVAVQEVEAIGYFGGGLVAVPALQGATFLVSIVFLFVQNVSLAVAALVMLPVQLTVLPRLQRRLNAKVRERVYATRTLSSLLTASGQGDVGAQSADARPWREGLKTRMRQAGDLERVRVAINELKGRLKGVYNYTSNLTPFFLFLVGGYLVVEGQLSLGALVAALTAYKEIAPALRELFDFAQVWSDARSRFEEISNTLGSGSVRWRCPG